MYGVLRHLVQHDNLWPINIIRLLSSESRINKTAYSCNAEFMVSFRTLMSENLSECPTHIFTKQGLIGLKSGPAFDTHRPAY